MRGSYGISDVRITRRVVVDKKKRQRIFYRQKTSRNAEETPRAQLCPVYRTCHLVASFIVFKAFPSSLPKRGSPILTIS